MISLLRSSARSSSSPNWSGWTNGRRAASDVVTHETGGAVDRPRRDQATFEMAAAQQRRRSDVSDVVQRHDGVDAGVRLRDDQQAGAVEQQLVAALGNVELRRRPCASATSTMRTPSCDATNTCVPSVSTMSPSSTPTSCVLVPEKSVPARCAGTAVGPTDASSAAMRGALPAAARLHHGHRAAGVVSTGLATQTPRRHSLQRLGLHVGKEVGALGEEPQPRRPERTELRRTVPAGRPDQPDRCVGVLSGCSVEVVGEVALDAVGESDLLPTQPVRASVAAATTMAAVGSVRVMRFRRCERAVWFPMNAVAYSDRSETT